MSGADAQPRPRPLMPVAEARRRIVDAMPRLPAETVPISTAAGRVLAEDVVARVTQPPATVSAMDGYAVRGADVSRAPARLARIGEVPAGGRFAGRVGAGQTVRIFTGAPLPDGADTIVIQEDTTVEGGEVVVNQAVAPGTYVRPAGLDFSAGDVGLVAGRVLTPRDVGLAAAMNVPWVAVRRRPRIALFATGDEIVRPGEPIGPSQIVSSNALALAALVEAAGGVAIDLGIARDSRESLERHIAAAAGCDLLITMGGASAGEHDLVKDVLEARGFALDFWQIAMRPGKPLMFGDLHGAPVVGLPGNPVSSLVCGLVFVVPALRAMLGLAETAPALRRAALGCPLGANDRREDYLRATLVLGPDGRLLATPFPRQDSSMLTLLARADCLVVRPPHALAARAGDPVDVIALDGASGTI